MTHPDLLRYLQENIQQPRDLVRQQLRDAGWPEADIRSAEDELGFAVKPPSPPSPPSQVPTELSDLVTRGVLTAEQARAVTGTMQVSVKSRRRFFSTERFIRFLAVFGALLVGIGIILFFASNWDAIPDLAKIVLLSGSTLLFYALGYILRFVKQRYPSIGEACFLIGAFLYGTSIFLILQTYHIQVEYPNEVLFWWLGILPLAYCFGLRSVGVLTHVLILFWFGYFLVDYAVLDSLFFGEGGSLSIMHIIALYIPLGALLIGFGRLYDRSSLLKPHGLFLRGLGYVSFGVAMFPFTSKYFGDVAEYVAGSGDEPALFWSLYLFFLFAAGFLSVGLYLRHFPRTFGVRLELFGVPLLAVLAAPFFIQGLGASPAIPIVFNILLFAFLVGLVAIGYYDRKMAFVNLGVTLLGLDILFRYFEYVSDLLEGSAFFITGGLLLIGLALVLTRTRQEIAGRIQAQPSP